MKLQDLDQPAGNTPDPVAEFLELLRSSALTSDDLDSIPEPAPVIDGLLYRPGIAWLYGKPGTFKSVLAVDWGCCVSVGLPWQQHESVQGPVIYFFLEGRAGLRPRIRAWEDRAGCKSQVIFQPLAVQLVSPTQMAALLEWLAELRPGLVIIDTQARVTLGVEENSATEMGRVVDAATAIIRACGCCLLLVHHEGRNGDNPRGSIAIEGAATSLFRTERDGDLITVQNRRQRDTAEADDITLRVTARLQSVLLDSNEGHWSMTRVSASERQILQLLSDVFPESGASATTLLKTTQLAESTFYDCIKKLVNRGEVVNTGSRNRSCYELTPKGQLQLTPMHSSAPEPEYSNSTPPFRGVEVPEYRSPGAPQATAGQWPEGSHGEAAS